ncbi:MAG: universal stress protein [Acidimicrobiales bacterium]
MGAGLLIVVGVDGSPSSSLALEWAIAEAVRCSGDLEVAVAWEPPDAGLEAYEYEPSEPTAEVLAYQRARRVAEVSAEQARRQLPADRVHVAVLEGGAAEQLVMRSADADVLVVGSRGRGGFAGLLLGSVSHQCTSHASCPVVVVRHLRGPAAK